MKNTLALEARYGGGRLELTPVAHPHDPDKAERPTWLAKLTGRGFEGAKVAGNFQGAEQTIAPGLVAEMVCPESPWEDQLLHESLKSHGAHVRMPLVGHTALQHRPKMHGCGRRPRVGRHRRVAPAVTPLDSNESCSARCSAGAWRCC